MNSKQLKKYLMIRGNFIDAGRFFLRLCPNCNRQNHAMWVAVGQCAWCGFIVEKSMVEEISPDKER